ncbi:SCO family protein [Acidihalobacter prosperus]|uniref:Thioredoxin domain-containing protein n=1 Tax=Acidihalobacter prosperus TaxID=160660 RepID=A0A1A6C3T8_9GAMM|nr:SCO family protein [Acidihalobacter prosperus]OBS09226.1 hypothetical protein Thpro_021554 [Acidihalobacter prosperus]
MGSEQFKRYKTPISGLMLGGVIGLIVAVALGSVLPWRPPPKKPDFAAAGDAPKTMFHAPSFNGFVNQQGQPVDSSAFKGKVLLVTFMYPYCTRVCPTLASRMVNLETLLRQRGLQDRVQLLSFNVDPEGAAPREMSRFMRQYGADPNSALWQFLTAPAALTARVLKRGFHADYRKIATDQLEQVFAQQRKDGTYHYVPSMRNPLADESHPDYAIIHNSSAIIVGVDGVVRYVLGDANTVSDAVMLNDIIRVLRKEGRA